MALNLFGKKKRNEKLIVRVLSGNQEDVTRLLDRKADPNFVFKAKQAWTRAHVVTPLYAALMAPKGVDPQIVQSLLDKGADPNQIVTFAANSPPYQSLLLIAVSNVVNASNATIRETNTEVYCALRRAKADMYCESWQHEYLGDVAFADLDYLEWDQSINYYLDQKNARAVWAQLEEVFEATAQKKMLNEALGAPQNRSSHRLKI